MVGPPLILGLTIASAAAAPPASAVASVAGAPPCAAPAGFDVARRVEAQGVVVFYRTVPAIEVGRHFAVEAVVCAPPPAPITAVRIDAHMPEHRHGMNYRPTISARGNGLYVAEGLLFHMPGRWQLLFDVERGGRTERLEAEIELE
jgi:hypothetical protein